MSTIEHQQVELDMHHNASVAVVEAVHFYIPTFAGGGAERFFIRLANEIASSGGKVHLVVNDDKGPLRELLDDKVELHVLGVKKAVFGLRRLVSYLKETQAKVLISALTRTNLVALMSANFAGTDTRVIVCERNHYTTLSKELDPIRRVLMKLLIRKYYPRAHAIIGNTEEVANDIADYAGVPRQKAVIIHNAAPNPDQITEARNAPVIHPWLSEPAPVAVAVGRLMPQKDYKTMLSAVAQSGDDLRLLVLGDGPERASLEDFARDLGIDHRVEFMGFRMDRFRFLVNADLFLLSSITEGFPNALVEAVAAGIPAISTDCLGGGAREIFGREFPERIVPIKDASAMASAIRKLVGERDDDLVSEERRKIAMIADRYEISEIAGAFLKSTQR